MADYGPTNFDIRHHFSFTPSYTLPSKKSPLQLLEGWSVQSAILVTLGTPMERRDVASNLSGSLEKKDRWDFFGNPSDFTQTSNVIPFYSGSNIAAMPAACTTAAASIGTTATSSGEVWLLCARQFGADCAATQHVRHGVPQHVSWTGLCRLGLLYIQEYRRSRNGSPLSSARSSSTS